MLPVSSFFSFFFFNVLNFVHVLDQERLEESKAELNGLLSDPDLATTPFVILGNKIDMEGALSEPLLRDRLGLHQTTGKGTVALPEKVRPIEVFMCSLVQKEGYGAGFQWLSQYIK